MPRLRFVTIPFLALGLFAGVAGASDASESAVYIEGYLDRAPSGEQALETVTITRDGLDRVLVVVTARSTERDGVAFGNGADELPLQVRGAKDEVSGLMKAEEGARIKATVKYYPASRALLVRDLDS